MNQNNILLKGILNINKPASWTSGDVVFKVRKILGVKTVGHMGTLDPQGTGVLVLGIGKAARLFDYYLKKDKVYEAEFEFGYETDTLDKDGQVTLTTNIIPTETEINEAIKSLTGKINQLPPKASAKNINGRRAYDLLRQGEEFELKPCEVNIFSIKNLGKTKENTYKFEIHCSGGTYIRSICRDLAYKLNSLATMVSICRTKCGDFLLSGSITIDDLMQKKEAALISLDDALRKEQRLDIDANEYSRLCNGIKLPIEKKEGLFTVYCKNELFGLGIESEQKLKITTYLKD